MRKRTLLSMLMLPPATAALSACGFQLRRAPTFQFRSLYVEAPQGAALSRELVRLLTTAGQNLRLVLPPTPRDQADMVLHILGERNERIILAKTVAGQIRELELRLHVRFRLTDQDGRIWIDNTEISQKRDMTYSESLTLAKDEEEASLIRNMRSDIAQQIVRRLALAQPPASE